MKQWIEWKALAGLLILLAASLAGEVRAATSQTIVDQGLSVLMQGELKGCSIDSDGKIRPALGTDQVGDSGAELVWDLLDQGRRGVLCATGHGGKLVRVKEDAEPVVVAEVDEPELTALLELEDGSVLAAAAPGATIYHLSSDDTLTTYTQLDATFIWRMAIGPKGKVWAATGADGKLFSISGKPGKVKVELEQEFDAANLLDLLIDKDGQFGPKGAFYLAAQDPGVLYRYQPGDDRPEVIFNSGAEEIRSLVMSDEGLVLALNTERSPTPQVFDMTLRMAGGRVSNAQAQQPQQPQQVSPQLRQVAAQAQGRNYGQPRSEVVLLTADGFAKKLWFAPERPIHSLVTAPQGGVLLAAGGEGHLYHLDFDSNASMLADLREDYLMRLVPSKGRYLIATARNGYAYSLSFESPDEPVYVSRAIDAEVPVRWGEAYWQGQLADGAKIEVDFRTSNEGDPEGEYWSDWEKAGKVAAGESLTMPAGPARYMQYRLRYEGKSAAEAATFTEALALYYSQPNAAPYIAKFMITEAPGKPNGAPQQAPPQVARPQNGAPGQPGGAPSASAGRDDRSNAMQMMFQWQVSDPNGDGLAFAIDYRGEDEQEWKEIAKDIQTPNLVIGTGGVADGIYRFRLSASDEGANAYGEGLVSEKISEQVIIDNTPPVIDGLKAKVKGDRARVSCSVSDAVSPVLSIRIDIDNGPQYMLSAEDGVLDEKSEEISFETEALAPGEHVLTLSATDQKGNTEVGKVVFTTE